MQGDFADGEVEGLGGGAEEAFCGIGERDFELGGGGFLGGESGLVEKLAHGEGAIFGGVDQRDGGAGDAGDGGFEERVVGAAEDEGVDAFG